MVDLVEKVAPSRGKSVAKTHRLKASLHCIVDKYGQLV